MNNEEIAYWANRFNIKSCEYSGGKDDVTEFAQRIIFEHLKSHSEDMCAAVALLKAHPAYSDVGERLDLLIVVPSYDDVPTALAAPMAAQPNDACKRCAAYKNLVKSLETQIAYHRDNAAKYAEAEKTLASEREANAMLTAELDAPPSTDWALKQKWYDEGYNDGKELAPRKDAQPTVWRMVTPEAGNIIYIEDAKEAQRFRDMDGREVRPMVFADAQPVSGTVDELLQKILDALDKSAEPNIGSLKDALRARLFAPLCTDKDCCYFGKTQPMNCGFYGCEECGSSDRSCQAKEIDGQWICACVSTGRFDAHPSTFCEKTDERAEFLSWARAHAQCEITGATLYKAWQARAALSSNQVNAQSEPGQSCQYCDGTGDVHDMTGEWRGECTECDAAKPSNQVNAAQPIGYIDRKDIARLSNYKATIWPGTNEIDAVAVYLAVQPEKDAELRKFLMSIVTFSHADYSFHLKPIPWRWHHGAQGDFFKALDAAISAQSGK